MKNKAIQGQQSTMRRSPVAHACLTFSMLLAASAAQAGAGWGVRGDTNPDGTDVRVPTYYAHTPSGPRFNVPPEAGATYDNTIGTGRALRKFVDALPGIRLPGAITAAGTLTDYATEEKFIPVATAQRWPGDAAANLVGTSDYYEIAVVEYSERLHSDLKKPTLLRGYVQIKRGGGGVPLFYPSGVAIQIQSVNADGSLKFDATTGARVMENAFGFEKPHYLGPAIVATKDRATRLKFLNLLPVGGSTTDANGVVTRNGDLFLPVDETLPGAGYGPDGLNRYRQNRALIHLHGGDNPWISDGTPHQWITPLGEENASDTKSLASSIADPAVLAGYLRGPSAQNVPDMPDPGPGAMTYYFPNGQTGRLEWYHDHSFGLTRLNVYAGMAAPYILSHPAQDAGLTSQGIPGELEAIPLIIQDKTFVPDDIGLQDARWNKTASGSDKAIWGTAGDMWYPHVYELNQDPNNSVDGTNAVGRWDWGPYFWPVFPALYNLPTGAVDDVTLTPEAWMDTPLVNGVAYPKLAVEPKTYRFRILNAANDRMLNLSMFVADTQVSVINITNGGSGYTAGQVVVELVDSTGALTSATADAIVTGGVVTAVRITNAGTSYTAVPSVRFTALDGLGSGAAATAVLVDSEVKMVPAVPQVASGIAGCAVIAGVEAAPSAAAPCWPSTWPTDGRDGGVPDPATVGPAFYQIGNEGGLLPKVAKIDATPMGYEYNRRSVTVLNTFTNGLFMGNAERADVLIDFSAYAGKKIILYSDAPAPVPAFDPRNDHWTGKPDEADAGSVETPQAGFGPNTRTVMQFVVGTTAAVPNPAAIANAIAALPTVYANTQEAPIVGQGYYNNSVAGGVKSWSESTSAVNGTRAYAGIFTGTLQEPAFNYQPGSGSALSVLLAPDTASTTHTGGLGYRTAPLVTFGTGTAKAVSSLRVGAFNVTTAGSGYTIAPRVTIANAVGTPGSGAAAEATLKVVGIVLDRVGGVTGGSGYLTAPTVTLSAPTSPPLLRNGLPTGSVQATATAIISAGKVTGFTITNPGKGYAGAPTVSIGAPPAGGVQAVAHSSGGVGEVSVVVSNPSKPNQAGGGGYARMADLTITLTAPQLTGGVTAVATPLGSVFDVSITNPGAAYTTLPSVAFSGGSPVAGAIAAQATAKSTGSLVVKNKAIQELFDPTYGRMNATLGVELPFTSALTQTTIPLGYVDPATEQFADGETQIWKITHNGVDAHPIHFHLMNVQVINRIGWDGTIKVPADNERGWKETLRFNPLEDVVIALRAKKPVLAGFGLPNSVRPMDPSQPLGVPTGFTQVDTVTGNPADVVNNMVNYGWEYVWHCHILGHEENDFMRPLVFDAGEAIPLAPSNLASSFGAVNNVSLTWTDNAQTEYNYQVTRSPAMAAGTVTLLANATGFTDASPAVSGTTYTYTVKATGAAGSSSASINVALPVAPAAPSNLTALAGSNLGITISFLDNSTNETQFVLERDAGTGWVQVGGALNAFTNTGNHTVTVPNAYIAGAVNQFRITAQLVNGTLVLSSLPSNTVTLAYPPAAPSSLATPTIVRITGNFIQDKATVTWGASDATATGYSVQYSLNNTNWTTMATTGPTVTTASSNVIRGLSYYFRVQATNAAGGSAYVTSARITAP